MKTNCIICKCEVENWDIAYPEDDIKVHPIGGTAFRTYGHYGSTIFDPMDASYLEVVFCDSCLEERMEYAYEGVNQKYKAELDEFRKKQDKLIGYLIELKDEEVHPHSSKEYVEWMAGVWKANDERNKNDPSRNS